MNLNMMDELLKKSLRPNRYNHSINTMNTAIELAKHYGADTKAVAIAGLLHDCAKNLSNEETSNYCATNNIQLSELEKKQLFLMHGAVGAIIAKNIYEVESTTILNAIKYHTTGCPEMQLIDKIIFLADYIEPARTHKEATYARHLAYEDIDKALIYTFDSVIKYVISRNGLIHPLTIEARNNLLLQCNKD